MKFKTGGAVPARYNFGGLGMVLTPLHIHIFVMREENKMHIVNIAC